MVDGFYFEILCFWTCGTESWLINWGHNRIVMIVFTLPNLRAVATAVGIVLQVFYLYVLEVHGIRQSVHYICGDLSLAILVF